VERRELVVPSLERLNRSRDLEKIANEILQMRDELEKQLGLSLSLRDVALQARLNETPLQLLVGILQKRKKSTIEPFQAGAVV
jgi:hypothetical protein